MKKIGLFGLGRQGLFLFQYLRKLSNVRIDFISTLDQDYQNVAYKSALAEISQQPPKKVRPDDFLADPAKFAKNIDGFVVASPTKMHVPIIKALSPFKKIIFVQKPFAMTLKQASEGWNQLAKDQTPCLVGFQRRFDPAHKALLKRVENQTIKSIRAVHSDNPRASLDYLKIAGSQPLDQGIHQLDFLSSLKKGQNPQSVFAQAYSTIPELRESGVTDRCLVFIKYKDGSTFNLELRRDSVVGYQNDFVVETNQEQLSVLEKFEKRAGSILSPVYFHDYKQRYMEAYYKEMDYFVEFMNKPSRHTVTQEKEILSTMKVLQAIQQSIRSEKIIRFEN